MNYKYSCKNFNEAMVMDIQETPNPVGQVIENQYIDIFVESMKVFWSSTKQKTKWYEMWKRVSMMAATNFLLKCLDDLIVYADQIPSAKGIDKKATVLSAVGKIYDYIAKETMPIWLLPFVSLVRDYILNILVSHAIDWIVAKYRNGDFKPKPADQLEAQWVFLYGQMIGMPSLPK